MIYQLCILRKIFLNKYLKWFLIYFFLILIQMLILKMFFDDAGIIKNSILSLYGILPFYKLDTLGKLILFFQIILNIYIVYTLTLVNLYF